LIDKSRSKEEQDNPPTRDSESSESLSDMEEQNYDEESPGQYNLLHFAASGGDLAIF